MTIERRRECNRLAQRRYRQRHSHEITEKRREYQKEYFRKNRARLLAQRKQSRLMKAQKESEV